jgi:hypothetical protein
MQAGVHRSLEPCCVPSVCGSVLVLWCQLLRGTGAVPLGLLLAAPRCTALLPMGRHMAGWTATPTSGAAGLASCPCPAAELVVLCCAVLCWDRCFQYCHVRLPAANADACAAGRRVT